MPVSAEMTPDADGYARARAVLGDRALREVDVDVLLLVEVRVNAQLIRAGADIGDGRLAALLHDGAEVARELQLACAVHDADFDVQHLAAD